MDLRPLRSFGGRLDGERVSLPDAWASSADGQFCLSCRRERAGDEALAAVPDESREARMRLRRTAIVEFEVRRTPEHADSSIAKACGSSAAVVAKVRQRLDLPAPTMRPAGMRRAAGRDAARR